jgi:signal transduction histidine kinase
MRTLLLELRPTGLVDVDLGDLLRQLGEAVAGRSGVSIAIDAAAACRLPPKVHVALYRIAQEALNNVARHARASRAWVSLRCSSDTGAGGQEKRVILAIRDNGRGFDPDSVPAGHLGLGIMRERAQAAGAVLTIESEPERGTELRVFWTAKAEESADE